LQSSSTGNKVSDTKVAGEPAKLDVLKPLYQHLQHFLPQPQSHQLEAPPHSNTLIANMNPEEQQIDDQEVDIDQNDIQQADQANVSDEKNLPGGGGQAMKDEASELDESNIIDDNSGPGGKSLRSNRGDPTAAVSRKSS
jgi:hypothetical protein